MFTLTANGYAYTRFHVDNPSSHVQTLSAGLSHTQMNKFNQGGGRAPSSSTSYRGRAYSVKGVGLTQI